MRAWQQLSGCPGIYSPVCGLLARPARHGMSAGNLTGSHKALHRRRKLVFVSRRRSARLVRKFSASSEHVPCHARPNSFFAPRLSQSQGKTPHVTTVSLCSTKRRVTCTNVVDAVADVTDSEQGMELARSFAARRCCRHETVLVGRSMCKAPAGQGRQTDAQVVTGPTPPSRFVVGGCLGVFGARLDRRDERWRQILALASCVLRPGLLPGNVTQKRCHFRRNRSNRPGRPSSCPAPARTRTEFRGPRVASRRAICSRSVEFLGPVPCRVGTHFGG